MTLDPTTRNATFDILISDPLEGLRPGMTVDATVILAKSEQALVLPRAAIRIRGDSTGVFTVEKNMAHWRPVTVGQAHSGQVRILSGLKGGETVIVTPDPRLQHGTRVQARNDWRKAP
jgi:multidrug efflux pump subunit AcrA (membrane-fusion protein)